VNPLERSARRLDALQQRHVALAFPIAVIKKYGDDQGSRLAALIAYYGFFSLFPLLLVFTSVLGFVLAGDPGLRQDLVDSAFGQFPVIGRALENRAEVQPLDGNTLGIVVGLATALWAGMGVAQAAETAMNTVWDIPRKDWPNFAFRHLRALGTLVLFGTILIASTLTSGFASSLGSDDRLARYTGWAVALVFNFVLFTLAYQLLTARMLRWRNVLPGSATAAVGWTVVQAAGGYIVTHQLRRSGDVYGTFALVIVLLVWIGLGAQLTLICAEINVVLHRRLWPRRIVQPPLSDADRRVYAGIVRRALMRPELEVRVDRTERCDRDEQGAR
jgi:YihY family inner membrane protein